MSTTYQIEKFSDVIEESLPLLQKHWDELARNKDFVPLDINYEAYRLLEKSNVLRVYTVRKDAVLIGYAVYVLSFNLHYKSTKFATNDIFWLTPEYRKGMIGLRLFQFVEEQLKLEGVSVMQTTYKIAHPAAQRVLEGLGHVPIEISYEKVLK